MGCLKSFKFSIVKQPDPLTLQKELLEQISLKRMDFKCGAWLLYLTMRHQTYIDRESDGKTYSRAEIV
jgi:hypothetical protein